MFVWDTGLPLLFLLSTVTAQATEPDCTNVADFGNCSGNAFNFCPRGIACGCKNEKPFCKCPSYQISWQNYWYMGPKCDQLWSTLDLILIAAVPGLTLTVTVAVLIQWISYCKKKPKKNASRSCPPARQRRPQAKSNPAYVSDEEDDDSRYASQQQARRVDKELNNFKVPTIQLRTDVGGFSYIPRPPSRRVMSVEDGSAMNSSPHAGYWQREIPNTDYNTARPFAAMPMQQLPKLSTSGYPQPDY